MHTTTFGVIDDARRRRRRRLRTVLVLAVCTGVGVGVVVGRTQSPPTRAPAARSTNGTPTGLAQAYATQSVSVGCRDGVYGTAYGQLAPDWRRTSAGTLVAGPMAWVYVRRYASDFPRPTYHPSYAPVDRLAPAVKVLAVVNVGRTVRVRIPVSERTRLSLDYTFIQPTRIISGNAYFRVAAGASEITFAACPRGPGIHPSQFAGGFIVAGAQCARLDIYVGNRRRPLLRQIPFGVPARSCPAAG